MAETEPTIDFPKWAIDNPVGGSGENARVEPNATKKANGFDWKERPPRQDHNWLFYMAGLWIQWFKQQVNATFNNLSAVITSAGATENMVANVNSLRDAMDDKYSMWEVSGIDITAHTRPGAGQSLFTFGAGKCIDSANRYLMQVSSGFSKMFQSGSYAQGTGNIGLATSVSITDATIYYTFVILFNDGTVDIAFDSDKDGTNAASMTDVVGVRRINWFYWENNSNGAYLMRQFGNTFYFTGQTGISTLNSSASTGSEDTAIAVPLGDVNLDLIIDLKLASGTKQLIVDSVERTTVGTLITGGSMHHLDSTLTLMRDFKIFVPRTNQKIRLFADPGVASASVVNYCIRGFVDSRLPYDE